MKLIDDEWIIKDHGNMGVKISHLCKGNPEDKTYRVRKRDKPLGGFWPIKDNKCFACHKEVPKHVLLYLTL